MSVDTQTKRISARDWNDIFPNWINASAELSIDVPGQAPDETLADLFTLETAFKSVPLHGEARLAVPGLPPTALHEAIFLLHKAANVLTSAQQGMAKGLPTWSIPTAYQSAFFSMEAVLLLLGVSVVEIDNKTMIVDLWPDVEPRASKKVKASYKIGAEAHFLHVTRVEHYHRWAILKRVLRMLVNAPISGALINALEDVDDKAFARQRNRLQYRTSWVFADLHAYSSSVQYCRFELAPPFFDRLDPASDDFSMALAMALLFSGVALLTPVADIATVVALERDLLAVACVDERLTLKGKFESAIGAPLFS